MGPKMSRLGLTPSGEGRGAAIVYGEGGDAGSPGRPVRTPSSGRGVKTTSAFPSGPIPDGNTEGTGVR